MTKQQILEHFHAAPKREKGELTRMALEWLAEKGIRVSRQALKRWRDTTTDTSKIRRFYHRAYESAIQRTALKPAAQQ